MLSSPGAEDLLDFLSARHICSLVKGVVLNSSFSLLILSLMYHVLTDSTSLPSTPFVFDWYISD